MKTQHYAHLYDVERWEKSSHSYAWRKGYNQITADHGEIHPGETRREVYARAKREGFKPEFHQTKAEAVLALGGKVAPFAWAVRCDP